MHRSRSALAVLMMTLAAGLVGIGFLGDGVAAEPMTVRRTIRERRVTPRKPVSAVKYLRSQPKARAVTAAESAAAARRYEVGYLFDPRATLFHVRPTQVQGSDTLGVLQAWNDRYNPTRPSTRALIADARTFDVGASAGGELVLWINEYNDGLADPMMNLFVAPSIGDVAATTSWSARLDRVWQSQIESRRLTVRQFISTVHRTSVEWTDQVNEAVAARRTTPAPWSITRWLGVTGRMTQRWLSNPAPATAWLEAGVAAIATPAGGRTSAVSASWTVGR